MRYFAFAVRFQCVIKSLLNLVEPIPSPIMIFPARPDLFSMQRRHLAYLQFQKSSKNGVFCVITMPPNESEKHGQSREYKKEVKRLSIIGHMRPVSAKAPNGDGRGDCQCRQFRRSRFLHAARSLPLCPAPHGIWHTRPPQAIMAHVRAARLGGSPLSERLPRTSKTRPCLWRPPAPRGSRHKSGPLKNKIDTMPTEMSLCLWRQHLG